MIALHMTLKAIYITEIFRSVKNNDLLDPVDLKFKTNMLLSKMAALCTRLGQNQSNGGCHSSNVVR